jgi:GTPase Era involved in 16S rRNA processing
VETSYKEYCWKNSTDELICVDTPGLADTKGRDCLNIEKMVEKLKNDIKEVSAIMIVVNGSSPRFDKNLQDMIILFKMIFGDEFINNVVFVFTNSSKI